MTKILGRFRYLILKRNILTTEVIHQLTLIKSKSKFPISDQKKKAENNNISDNLYFNLFFEDHKEVYYSY